MVVNAMVEIRLCKPPSDENTGCKILDSFIDNTHQDIAGELAGLLSIFLDSEKKNNFRTWRRYAPITAQLISSEVSRCNILISMSNFEDIFQSCLERLQDQMVQLHMWAHPRISLQSPEPETILRRNENDANDYIGKPVIEIDQKIQAGINSKSTSPLDTLSEEECQQRNKMELQNWIVFRCSADENSLHPNHCEPRCSKYFLYHLNKTDWV